MSMFDDMEHLGINKDIIIRNKMRDLRMIYIVEPALCEDIYTVTNHIKLFDWVADDNKRDQYIRVLVDKFWDMF